MNDSSLRMHSKINRSFRLLLLTSIVLYYHGLRLEAQSNVPEDLSLWTWAQVYKDISDDVYVSVQYQLRLNQNMQAFESSNFYFLGGWNLHKRWNVEGLYQINTSYRRDIHTFYAGVTHKKKIKKTMLFYRTAFQHSRNFFTGENKYDRPLNEWRNRLRVKQRLNKNFDLAISAEPTMVLSEQYGPYVEKIRCVGQLTANYNKYQSITLFYMYQPSVSSFSRPDHKYMLGMTYQLNLPSKLKRYKKIFKPSFDKKEQERDKDIF